MNKQLELYEKGVENNIKPEDKKAFDQIVTAGLKLAASEELYQDVVDTLSKEGSDLPSKVADGVARLISLMHQTSQNTMPVGPAIAASYILMVKALDFAERALGETITDDVIANSALATTEAVCNVFGITQEKLAAAVEQGAQQQGKGSPPIGGPGQPIGRGKQAAPPAAPAPPPGAGAPPGLLGG
jgi:hypothetical protein